MKECWARGERRVCASSMLIPYPYSPFSLLSARLPLSPLHPSAFSSYLFSARLPPSPCHPFPFSHFPPLTSRSCSLLPLPYTSVPSVSATYFCCLLAPSINNADPYVELRVFHKEAELNLVTLASKQADLGSQILTAINNRQQTLQSQR